MRSHQDFSRYTHFFIGIIGTLLKSSRHWQMCKYACQTFFFLSLLTLDDVDEDGDEDDQIKVRSEKNQFT